MLTYSNSMWTPPEHFGMDTYNSLIWTPPTVRSITVRSAAYTSYNPNQCGLDTFHCRSIKVLEWLWEWTSDPRMTMSIAKVTLLEFLGVPGTSGAWGNPNQLRRGQ
eukprot:1916856-Amphidinium_carterae.1